MFISTLRTMAMRKAMAGASIALLFLTTSEAPLVGAIRTNPGLAAPAALRMRCQWHGSIMLFEAIPTVRFSDGTIVLERPWIEMKAL